MSRLETEDEIRRLILLTAQLVDDKRFEAWSQLFADGGRFTVGGRTLVGREEMASAVAEMMGATTTKHLIAWPVIDLTGTEEARAWSDLATFVRTDAGPVVATIGRYYDELGRDASGRWRLTSRVLVPAGDAPPDEVQPGPSS